MKIQRENDGLIMENIIKYAKFTVGQLQKVNSCRMYLQVSTVSDITTGNGLYIQRTAWKGEIDQYRSHQYAWPRQSCP